VDTSVWHTSVDVPSFFGVRISSQCFVVGGAAAAMVGGVVGVAIPTINITKDWTPPRQHHEGNIIIIIPE